MTKFRRARTWIFGGCGSLLILPVLLYGGYLFWYSHRRQPASLTRKIFPGIVYHRNVTKTPVAQVFHLVVLPLNTPGLRFLVTPGERGKSLPLKARTTSQFASEFGVQIALNGDYFYPWHSNGVFDYYPHAGDSVTSEGFSASAGVPYSEEPDKSRFPTVYLSEKNEVTFARPARIHNALSGLWTILKHGQPTAITDLKIHPDRDPRSALGLSEDGKILFLLVIDGRQPHYSEGATVRETAEILKRAGAGEAILLDGGGSSCLVVQKPEGDYETLNSVIDKRLPGRQRPLANHLGVFLPH